MDDISCRMTPPLIVVVAQTPPPIHGQSIMTEILLSGEYSRIRIKHIRMNFSNDIKTVGIFRLSKVFHLITIIAKIWSARLFHGCTIFYYPPAGPSRVPFFRDCVILISSRWLFPKVVFHFHANGISTLFSRLNWMEKLLFRMAYSRPELCIRLSTAGPDDPLFIKSKRTTIIPNGIPDDCVDNHSREPRKHPPRIMYLGTLIREKGCMDLIDACGELKMKGIPFECVLAGAPSSDEFAASIAAKISQEGLEDCISVIGHVGGVAKRKLFESSSVFCFPTFYEAEGLPLVLIEALQHGLPAVTTHWRGIPEVIVDNKCGFLVPARSPLMIAERLERLLIDQDLREAMGRAARLRYEENFEAALFQHRIESELSEL